MDKIIDFSNIFHQFQDINKIDLDGTKVTDFWKISFNQSKYKIYCNMKDCILFSGHFRTFEKTKQNIKAFIEENNMDVYCHLWVVNKEEVDIIENELKPVKMSYGYTKEFENSFMHLQERINQKNPKPNNTDNLASQASNHFSRYQAYNLVNKKL
jgi:hypothetical protein